MLKISSFEKLTPVRLRTARQAAHESITAHEKLLLEVCCKSHSDAMEFMQSRESGLAESEVENLRDKWGPNHLGRHTKHGFITEILLRCKNPLIIQLLVIAATTVCYAVLTHLVNSWFAKKYGID